MLLNESILKHFSNFAQTYLVEYENLHLLQNPRYQQASELASRLQKTIMEHLSPELRELVLRFEEIKSYQASLAVDCAFMAGFKAGVELFRLCDNPADFIASPWAKENTEKNFEEIERAISEAKNRRLKKVENN